MRQCYLKLTQPDFGGGMGCSVGRPVRNTAPHTAMQLTMSQGFQPMTLDTCLEPVQSPVATLCKPYLLSLCVYAQAYGLSSQQCQL